MSTWEIFAVGYPVSDQREETVEEPSVESDPPAKPDPKAWYDGHNNLALNLERAVSNFLGEHPDLGSETVAAIQDVAAAVLGLVSQDDPRRVHVRLEGTHAVDFWVHVRYETVPGEKP